MKWIIGGFCIVAAALGLLAGVFPDPESHDDTGGRDL